MYERDRQTQAAAAEQKQQQQKELAGQIQPILDAARDLFATKDYTACRHKLDEARPLLDRLHVGANQQDWTWKQLSGQLALEQMESCLTTLPPESVKVNVMPGARIRINRSSGLPFMPAT